VSPRKAFDRFMVSNGIGSNPKVGRLTDAEFRCLVAGVWPLAAEAPVRGALLVGTLEVEPRDVALKAGKSVAVAASTLAKMKHLGMLERDDEIGAWVCHDWEEINPSPRNDPTNAERQRRYRERHGGDRNAPRNGGSNAPSNAALTAGKLRSPSFQEGENIPRDDVPARDVLHQLPKIKGVA
jgi:hypothetical protein